VLRQRFYLISTLGEFGELFLQVRGRLPIALDYFGLGSVCEFGIIQSAKRGVEIARGFFLFAIESSEFFSFVD
jgi:hypothetical protein